VFGRWEGDLLIFECELGHANVTTLVERKSRYTVMIKNPSRHSRPIMDKIVETFSPLPSWHVRASPLIAARSLPASGLWKMATARAARSAIPAHRGRKALWRMLTSAFAASCQGTDLAAVSQRDLIQLARRLNDQPRRCLGYRTPAEVFMAHLQEAGMIPYPEHWHMHLD